MKKIAHLTSVHSVYDTRIFYKECASLAEAGYEVVLVAPHPEDEMNGAVRIRAVPQPKGRAERVARTTWHVYRAALDENAALYHLHDPELLPVGLLLRLAGKRVLYDVHEDVPLQLRTKYWLPAALRWPMAFAAKTVEGVAARVLSGIVAATPTIAGKFPPGKTVTVQNFPLLSELSTPEGKPYSERPMQAAYVGNIRRERGIEEMVQATGYLPEGLNARLTLAGEFRPHSLKAEMRKRPAWSRVDHLGWIDRAGVRGVLSKARLGLVTLHPSPNIVESQPTKLYEYMAAGLPVIASDFSLWRRIVDGAQCGLLVNPMETEAIAEAMRWLLEHPSEAEEMGRRGRAAVEAHYNWDAESSKLLKMYSQFAA